MHGRKNKNQSTTDQSYTYPSSSKNREALRKFFSTAHLAKKENKKTILLVEEENWSSDESDRDETDGYSDQEEKNTIENKQEKIACVSKINSMSIVNMVTHTSIEEKSDHDVQTTVATEECFFSDKEEDEDNLTVNVEIGSAADNSFFSAKSSSTNSSPNLSRNNSNNFEESKSCTDEKLGSQSKDKSLMRRQKLQTMGTKARNLKLMQDPNGPDKKYNQLSTSNKTFFTVQQENPTRKKYKKVRISEDQMRFYANKKLQEKGKSKIGLEKYVDKKNTSIIIRPGKK